MADFRYPAICEFCGLLFPSPFAFVINGDNGPVATFNDCHASCPRCGQLAQVPSGTVQILQRGIRLFRSDEFTKEVFEALGIAVEDLRSGRMTDPNISHRLALKSPSLAKEFREWAGLGINFVIAMAAVASAILVWKGQPATNRAAEDVAVEAFHSTYDEPQPIVQPKFRFSDVPQYRHEVPVQQKNRKMRRAERAKRSPDRR